MWNPMKTDRRPAAGEGREPVIAPNPLCPRGREQKADLWKWISLAVMLVLSFAVFEALSRRGSSDLSIHATWASEGDFLHPRTFVRHMAHPLWHGLVVLLTLFSVPAKLAAALVTTLLKTAELWLIHRLMTAYLGRELGRGRITLAAFAVSVVAALWVPWVNPHVYIGAGTPNTWHSPTQIIAMVAMLLCAPYAAHCYAEFERLLPLEGERTRLPQKKAVALGALLFISLLAKPTFMQAFLPAACLYFLAQWIRHPKNSRFFLQVILAVLPAVLFMIAQYLYYFGIIIPSQGRMVLDISWEKLVYGLRAVLLIAAFPLAQLLLFYRKGRGKDPLAVLTALFFAVGVVEYLILGEDGRRASDGNFGWGMMGASLMLWVMMLIEFLRDWARARREKEAARQTNSGKTPARKNLTATGFAFRILLLLWHLGSGIYYVIYLLTTGKSL
jgi:hypothetical protein